MTTDPHPREPDLVERVTRYPIRVIMIDPERMAVSRIELPLTGDEELVNTLLECDAVKLVELHGLANHHACVDADPPPEKMHGWAYGDMPFFGRGLVINVAADGEWLPPTLGVDEVRNAIRFFGPPV